MDKMAEAMIQVPAQAAQDSMLKTPKHNDVVTSKTVKDKSGQG